MPIMTLPKMVPTGQMITGKMPTEQMLTNKVGVWTNAQREKIMKQKENEKKT